MSELVERLREHATDWDGSQMDDREPAKGDPTAGTLREAAARIEALEAQLAQAREALTGAHDHIDAMQDVIRHYLPPDSGVSGQEALNELIELLDGPRQRELFRTIKAAQADRS